MRDPQDIMHNGKTVAEILRLHKLWLAGKTGGERANLSGANLSGADLSGANLRYANLSCANLCNADLSGANLFGAYLSDANLFGAVLSHAYISGANLCNANLCNADLSGAVLSHAYISGANLSGADLSGANLNGTVGNMDQIKSAQFDIWPITWTTAPDNTVTLQIGCQKNDLALWEKSDPRWIEAMDDDATEWWAKYREVVLTLVKTSPATPWAEKKETDND